MTLQRLVVKPGQIQGETLTLTPEQQHYLQRVLRLRDGAQFIVLDGTGQQWQAALAAHDKATLLAPLAAREAQTVEITLAAALPKQGFDQVVRQVTELGVSRIVPILSDRTMLRPSSHKVQRWQRIVTEAAEQCERAQVPTVLEPTPWTTWLETGKSGLPLIAVARGDPPSLLSVCGSSPQLEIAIGPEGGWTQTEIAAAMATGYQPVSLGCRILRALTAPVAALAVIQAAYGESNRL
ncbi:MAG: 16S rRNA (uracil(1498)-N(3))-methyltransferase [Leptolyngbyaceae cyanobacterium]